MKKYVGWFKTSRLENFPNTEEGMMDFLAEYRDGLEGGVETEDDLFFNVKDGDRMICTLNGVIVTRMNGVLGVCGTDENWLEMYKKYQHAQGYKENTAFKIIERTAKADVWARVARDLKNVASGIEDEATKKRIEYHAKWYREKAESHWAYLAQQDVTYNYATQNFEPRIKPTDTITSEITGTIS